MLFFAEVYQIQHLRCKDTQILSYKHQVHQKIIQYSDNQQLYTPFSTISGAKLRNAAKVKHLFGLCKGFEGKVWKWRWFLTDVGCFEMQNAASYVVHEDQWTDRLLITDY